MGTRACRARAADTVLAVKGCRGGAAGGRAAAAHLRNDGLHIWGGAHALHHLPLLQNEGLHMQASAAGLCEMQHPCECSVVSCMFHSNDMFLVAAVSPAAASHMDPFPAMPAVPGSSIPM